MIQANELRIGNWVYVLYKEFPLDQDHYDKKACPVTRIRSNGFIEVAILTQHDYHVSKIEGIPLTPEILEKAGFEISDWLRTGVKNIYYKEGMGEFLTYEYDGCCVYQLNKKVIQYVHQLQNLYFALTGEELEIDLKIPATFP